MQKTEGNLYKREHLRCAKSLGNFGIDFMLMQETPVGHAYGNPVVMTEMPVGVQPSTHAPTFNLGEEQCEFLMDELWKMGIRPSNGEGSTGQIKAMEDHLNDMRTIAFSELNIETSKDK